MECKVHSFQVKQVCFRQKCNYRIFCGLCIENKHHMNHDTYPLEKLLTWSIDNNSFNDKNFIINYTDRIYQLDQCSNTFSKMNEFLRQLDTELRNQYNNNPINKLFQQKLIEPQAVQNKFIELCTDMNLQMTKNNTTQKVKVEFKNNIPQIMYSTLCELVNSFNKFHQEILSDLSIIVNKITTLESFIEQQIKDISVILLTDQMKDKEGVQPLDQCGLKPALQCFLCGTTENQQTMIWDPVTSKVYHNDCYSFSNCQQNPDQFCEICKQDSPTVKCSECDIRWHYNCILLTKPGTPDYGKFLVDKFEHKVTCLSHDGETYLQEIKIEEKNRKSKNLQKIILKVNRWNTSEIENRSQQFSQSDYEDLNQLYNREATYSMEGSQMNQDSQQYQQEQQHSEQQQQEHQQTNYFRTKHPARFQVWQRGTRRRGIGRGRGLRRRGTRREGPNGVSVKTITKTHVRVRGGRPGRPRGSRNRRHFGQREDLQPTHHQQVEIDLQN